MHSLKAPESLTPEEQAVLELAAQNRGGLEIANRSDTRGLAVRGGKHKLYDPQDMDYAKKCCDAVPRLVEWQLLRSANKPRHYELTNFGWQLSRKLTILAKQKKMSDV